MCHIWYNSLPVTGLGSSGKPHSQRMSAVTTCWNKTSTKTSLSVALVTRLFFFAWLDSVLFRKLVDVDDVPESAVSPVGNDWGHKAKLPSGIPTMRLGLGARSIGGSTRAERGWPRSSAEAWTTWRRSLAGDGSEGESWMTGETKRRI